MATNFGTKLTITRPPWRIIASSFHLSPIFWPALSDGVICISPDDSCCHGNEFRNKIDYNSAKANCTLFSFTLYFRARAMQWCHVNLSLKDPCCRGNQPFLFKDKIGCRLTRSSNAETQLLSYIAWQWDKYLVP